CLAAACFVADPQAIHNEVLRGLVLFAVDYRPGLMLVGLGIVLASQIANEVTAKSKIKKTAIRGILDSLHEEYFGWVPDDEKFNHRVTLFVRKRLARCCFRSYLVIYARVGTH